ncbi:hypothetical protein HYH03_003299 [Edaphochlamys debaryana]|uniref:Uncharacterized protein n=1 Tax=Edaphochlamys debaryana TaxID=47281 RepID=A0A835YC45_9CHLO|nr:hypothetical protein HYH03_003299 [Edaphochlamys debaryana]|eukprot:KAG2498548.1 hypothetical protein HYH03_003299 [Edaphochlamys debaryana]
MEELCMHWRALAGPLLWVKLGTQSLLGGSDSLEQLFGPDYAFKYGPDPLRAHRTLLSRCDQPEVAAVRVAQDAELDEVLYTIDVFSAAPELRLDTAVGDWALPLRPPSRQPAPLCTGPQLLSEESVLGLALQRIADAGPEVLPSQHQWPWEAGSTESTYSAWPPLLLLRGSVGMAAAASSACQGLKASGALKAVLPLPGDSAALLLCESRKGAAAVVAAAVAPLGAASRFGPTPLRWALQQVVAKLWTDATDGGVGLAERVRWALGVRDHLGSLPKDLRQWPGALL